MNAENAARIIAACPAIFGGADSCQPFAMFGFECGDGWADLLVRLAERIKPLRDAMEDPGDLYVMQVKEKFGGLRFYVSVYTNEIDAAIKSAEAESFVTCESCGEPGVLRGRWWMSVRCDGCAA